jgi:ribosomal protein S18 acetylase RimI-like enzyme
VFQISPANTEDLDDIVQLRENATKWLRTKQTDQWQEPWPTAKRARERMLEGLQKGTTWIVRISSEPVATFVVDEFSDPGLWTEPEQSERALYVHRFVVHRDYSGIKLGATLMDLIGARAAHGGYRWLRVDVWTTNERLQQYYRDLGFADVRTIRGKYPSGALLQRPVPERSHGLAYSSGLAATHGVRPDPRHDMGADNDSIDR